MLWRSFFGIVGKLYTVRKRAYWYSILTEYQFWCKSLNIYYILPSIRDREIFLSTHSFSIDLLSICFYSDCRSLPCSIYIHSFSSPSYLKFYIPSKISNNTMQLLSYPLITGLIGQTMAVSMSSRFTVSSTCSTSKVDDMLTETIGMVDTAIEGIDTLLTAGARLNPNVTSNAIKSLTKAATTAWGVSEPKWWSYYLSVADTAQLKLAQGIYI